MLYQTAQKYSSQQINQNFFTIFNSLHHKSELCLPVTKESSRTRWLRECQIQLMLTLIWNKPEKQKMNNNNKKYLSLKQLLSLIFFSNTLMGLTSVFIIMTAPHKIPCKIIFYNQINSRIISLNYLTNLFFILFSPMQRKKAQTMQMESNLGFSQ